jgi:hypothetical protein
MGKYIFYVTFLLVLCGPASAGDWYCRSLGQDSLVDAANRWQRRDGAIGFVVSDQFLLLLAACPQETYTFMLSRPEILNSWLEEVEQLSGFTVTPEQRQEREITLSKLVESMKSEQPAQGTANVRDRILKRLETVCVRTVDEAPPRPPCQRVALQLKP